VKKLCSGMLASAVGCASALLFPAAAGAQTETVLHSFGNGVDGQIPSGKLFGVTGTLYGTTQYGGVNCQGGCGTVFALAPDTGTETVLCSFCSQRHCKDGALPWAGLIDVKGTLYGTTASGGAYDYGSVFALNPNGNAEKVLYSFAGEPDGECPGDGLIELKGAFYGTTTYGGEYGGGTVFAVNTPTGIETVLHSFGGATDGIHPIAGLVAVKGTLYGTTEFGGAGTCNSTGSGCGTVFSLDPDNGAET
jgi:uncharacterized repeat protein (TIGR03803 family)